MAPLQTRSGAVSSTREQTRDYIFKMIWDLAQMARKSGETSVAMHLETTVEARRRELENRHA